MKCWVINNPTYAAADWKYSSIHRYIRHKIISPDWGNSPISLSNGIGSE
ncbi:MAG: hypothetical protein KAG06_02810 [Methylococcales bacterium]|nr:hypothetical protein [Methylococcales bacterium]